MEMHEFFRARHAELARRERAKKERNKERIKEIATAALIIPGGLGLMVLIGILGGVI